MRPHTNPVLRHLPVLALALLPTLTHADTPSTALASAIHIQNCWIRALPGNLPAAGYFHIQNSGAQTVTLSGVRTDAYAHTMLHRTVINDGVSKMLHMHSLSIPAQGHHDFSPGGYHLMLENATRAVAVGDTIPITFVFKETAPIQADCVVRAPNSAPETPHTHSAHH